jgi:hypothetical protein
LDELSEDSKTDLKISTEKEKNFNKTYKMMEEFCFLISVTGFNRHNTGKDELPNKETTWN